MIHGAVHLVHAIEVVASICLVASLYTGIAFAFNDRLALGWLSMVNGLAWGIVVALARIAAP